MAATFELARMTKSLDYRTFLGHLLGKGWIAYEFVYVAGMILVVSVLRDDWTIGVVGVLILCVGNAALMLLAHILRRVNLT